MFIYVITNLITGKIYIGQHKGANLKQYLQKKFYWARTQKTGSSYLFNAMRKHPDYRDWSIEPLMELETKEELDRLEKLLIALYDTRNSEVGYNICKGGEGFTGPFTVEHRAKLSAAARITKNYLKSVEVTRGVPRPTDVRARISKSHNGKVVSQETRDKLRAARLLQKDPRLGTHHTAESNEKNRQAHLKMKLSTLITEDT